MHNKTKLAALIGLALMASTAWADIKIALIGPYTGGSAPFGVSMRDGAKLAAAEINAKGGVLGQKILFVERDDESKPERGPMLSNEAISKEGVVAGIGFVNYGVALPSLKVWQEAGIPLIVPVSAGGNLSGEYSTASGGNYIFRVTTYDKLQTKMVARYISGKGIKKVALLADTTAYGQQGSKDITEALASFNIAKVADEKFNLKDSDMTPQLLRARQSGAEAIVMWAVGPEAAAVAKGRVKLGWNVPIFGGWGIGITNFADIAKEAADGAIMPSAFIQSAASTAKQKKFVADYQAAYKIERIPMAPAAAQAYDAVYLLAAGMTQAGGTNGKAVKSALENLNAKVEGVITTYDKPFSPLKHEALYEGIASLGRWDKGQVVKVAK